jgi:diguanylate cyclase (GGDEF)-like protein
MYFHLNNLKIVNDIYSDEIGAFLIPFISNTLSNSIRNEYMIARLSGDEFFLGVYQSDLSDNWIASRIQKTLESLMLNDNGIRNTYLSVGCKIFKSSADFNTDKMLSETDSLMYENKKMMRIRNIIQ